MDLSNTYRVNQPQVILETFDDEVVIVNLDTGNYYSLDNTGMAVWRLLESGAPLGRIVTALNAQYDADEAEIAPAIARFIGELVDEALLVPGSPPAAAQTGTLADKHPVKSEALPHFTAPVLNKYSDMQELLLLDPIHDVDEAGWPTLPQSLAEEA